MYFLTNKKKNQVLVGYNTFCPFSIGYFIFINEYFSKTIPEKGSVLKRRLVFCPSEDFKLYTYNVI